MKSLLSISLLSILLSVCNGNKQKEQQPENTAASERIDPETMPEQNEYSETETTMDGASADEKAAEPTAEKPGLQGEMPDTSKKQVIEHGSPDQARNDSVKAAKTKGKY
ncbi:MAG: hypothetical protein H6602_04045 [Flavobacteriales bacterium]|nr:hypothetical protein [Flavobacteriales bacterium]MCB9190813.1 hypothetical protein [Flavobacteriales bacterium]